MPVTRAAGLATPVNSAPNSSRPTSDGTISSAIPVATSSTARASSFLIALATLLVLCPGDSVRNRWHLLAILLGVLRRTKIERQFVDLTSELERAIVAILDHRHTGACVLSNVEVLILWEGDRDGVFDRLLGHGAVVHEQLTRTTFAEAGAGVL